METHEVHLLPRCARRHTIIPSHVEYNCVLQELLFHRSSFKKVPKFDSNIGGVARWRHALLCLQLLLRFQGLCLLAGPLQFHNFTNAGLTFTRTRILDIWWQKRQIWCRCGRTDAAIIE